MSRLRNIPGAREAVGSSPYVAQDPEQNRGKWQSFFGNGAPLFVEIGTGKGKFLTDLAARHPENNYLGMEMYSTVLLKAVQKAEAAERERTKGDDTSAGEPASGGRNFCFVRYDATDIEQVFAPGEVDGIYLNFSDPWPKDRHAHRRLTSDRFLARYEKILAPEGRLEFKTDNADLFEYSLEMLKERNWQILAFTRDLYGVSAQTGSNVASILLSENVPSEYEEKFAGRGNPICKLIAVPPSRA